MECVVPLGCTNKATLGIKLLAAIPALAGELWLSVHFNEHTMAAFLFKCIEEPAYGAPPAPAPLPPTHPLTPLPPAHPPTPYILNP